MTTQSIFVEVGQGMKSAVETELHEAGEDLVRRVVAEIHRLKLSFDGDLAKSVTYDVRETPTGFLLEVGPTAKHGEWVHDGTGPAAGHDRYMPPLEPILRYARKKLGFTRAAYRRRYGYDDRKRFGTLDSDHAEDLTSLANAIRWKIYQRGTAPRPYLQNVFEVYEPLFRERVLKAVAG